MKTSAVSVPGALLPVPHPDVIFRALPDGAVLFHSAEEVYFGLNPVGARIWELLPPKCETLGSLCADLGELYPAVDADELCTDIGELLAELLDQGLVVPAEESA
jgi:hypothetical protein